jgi:hypothetical protein
VVGASGGNPGFKLPVDFCGSVGIADRVVHLDLHELRGMARGTFNAHLRPVHQSLFLELLCMLFHRSPPFFPKCLSLS